MKRSLTITTELIDEAAMTASRRLSAGMGAVDVVSTHPEAENVPVLGAEAAL